MLNRYRSFTVSTKARRFSAPSNRVSSLGGLSSRLPDCINIASLRLLQSEKAEKVIFNAFLPWTNRETDSSLAMASRLLIRGLPSSFDDLLQPLETSGATKCA